MDRYLLQLMLSKGIGNSAIKKIINDVSIREAHSFEEYCEDSLLLQSVLYRPQSVSETMQSIASNGTTAGRLSRELESQSITVITEVDDGYPEKLKTVLGKECPPVLFLKGNIDLLNSSSVGFCGSRKASKKGIAVTEQCSRQLVNHDITVVSGYAGGTDLAAHRATLKEGGNTVFVLAEGILEYGMKSEVGQYLNNSNHLFVSQFLPDAKWSASNAMRRNSVIIGLSKAMILVEAGKSGGTFAAGEEALKRKFPLFVIDYAKPEVSAEANPFFIEKGGKPIRSRAGLPNLDAIVNLSDRADREEVSEQLTIF